MKEMCGVTSQEATINDFQRYFKCKDVLVADCNDKGLTFPETCSVPPCNQCFIGNLNNQRFTYEGLSYLYISIIVIINLLHLSHL